MRNFFKYQTFIYKIQRGESNSVYFLTNIHSFNYCLTNSDLKVTGGWSHPIMKWIWRKDRQTNTLTLTPVVSLLYILRPTWSARVHTAKGIKRKLSLNRKVQVWDLNSCWEVQMFKKLWNALSFLPESYGWNDSWLLSYFYIKTLSSSPGSLLTVTFWQRWTSCFYLFQPFFW